MRCHFLNNAISEISDLPDLRLGFSHLKEAIIFLSITVNLYENAPWIDTVKLSIINNFKVSAILQSVINFIVGLKLFTRVL